MAGSTDFPPDYIIDAIPGARELASAHFDARVELAKAAEALTTAREEAAELSLSGNLVSPSRAPGVPRADWQAAVDRYHDRSDDVRMAEHALTAARERLQSHVDAGMATEEFAAQHEKLLADAHRAANRALATLRTQLTQRDKLLAAVGRRARLRTEWYGIDNALHDVTEYVTAGYEVLDNFEARAVRMLDNTIMLPEDKGRFVARVRALDVADITTDEKLATLKREFNL